MTTIKRMMCTAPRPSFLERYAELIGGPQQRTEQRSSYQYRPIVLESTIRWRTWTVVKGLKFRIENDMRNPW